MGRQGDKASTRGARFADAIVPKLASLGEVTTKSMFGGYGIFQAGKMFALVTSDAELFLKTDDSNRAQFANVKSPQHGKMPYFRVPGSVLKNNTRLLEWARTSVKVAHG